MHDALNMMPKLGNSMLEGKTLNKMNKSQYSDFAGVLSFNKVYYL